MRIRDKLFPEGSKTRKVLRAMAISIKGVQPKNLKKVYKAVKEQ